MNCLTTPEKILKAAHALFEREGTDAARLSLTFNVALDAVIEGMAQGLLKQDDPHDVTMTIWAHQHGLIALYRPDVSAMTRRSFAPSTCNP
ncbi:hypothetical protein GCM10007862_04150 [Dyella lipolytica]|uniref:Uncharacterized protein n=1 Tax=Dyella lipolytica TaxID=1867835 RepID=A0ABW8J1D9_9GAMM|nr:hypothetical protein [Dyella lipolytica]GLQ45364.1 hypothetical protein GCM10007862_04150 [Dyella lipolytica]